jgi:hypothetical protein
MIFYHHDFVFSDILWLLARSVIGVHSRLYTLQPKSTTLSTNLLFLVFLSKKTLYLINSNFENCLKQFSVAIYIMCSWTGRWTVSRYESFEVLHGTDYEECRLLGYKTQFVLHSGHITSPLQRPVG